MITALRSSLAQKRNCATHPLLLRSLDIISAFIWLILLSPLFLTLAVATRIEDREGVFFRQLRLGYKRRPFRILKLRTMREGQVTRIGAWLRPTGLDETAQFYNVLRGEMSMVGPRPLTFEDVQRLRWTGPEHDLRWAQKPGMTGLPGVFGSRNRAHSRRLDLLYARRHCVLLNTQLIAISFGMIMVGKHRMRAWLKIARREGCRVQRSKVGFRPM